MESPFRADILRGKVALLTGGATGITLEIARAFGKHGASVVITGRRKEKIDEAVISLSKDGIAVLGCPGDVRSLESMQGVVDAAVKRFGRLDILVNGAAGNFLCAAADLSVNGFKTVLDIDTGGCFIASKAAFPALCAAAAGGKALGACSLILNITATLHYGQTPYQAHASAAKAAIDSLTRSLAVEWAAHGIRVNGIAPGPIRDTEGISKLGGEVSAEEELCRVIPRGRVGWKDDIGMAALYLASKAADFVTGEILVVDGGSWLYRESYISPETYAAMRAAGASRPATQQKARL